MLAISEHTFVYLMDPGVKRPIQISNVVSPEFPSWLKHGRVFIFASQCSMGLGR